MQFTGQHAVGILCVLLFLISGPAIWPAAHASSARLSWDPVSDRSSVGYRVYLGIAPHSYTNWLDVGNTTNAQLSGLIPGGTYFVSVTAYNALGLESPNSSEMRFTLPAQTNFVPRFAIASLQSRQILLSGTGPLGYVYDVQASINLKLWTTNGSVQIDQNGEFQFIDPMPATNSRCFYRLSQSYPYLQPRSWMNVVASTNNLALRKPATQSSTYHLGSHPASAAVDGNTTGEWESGSVASTEATLNAWWQVDLGSVQDVSTVKLWNRTDCCSQRLGNYYVLVSSSAFQSTNLLTTLTQPGVSSVYQATANAGAATISVGKPGRYVRVQLAGTDFLSLGEVQVFGTVTNIVTVP